jgi:hydrogenase maturation protease
MSKRLVLGVGNLLLSDEGVGIHAVQALHGSGRLPEDVEVVDGATAGLGLLYYIEGVERLVIVDAMETGAEPGTLRRLTGDQLRTYLSMKVSPHEITLTDFLATAKLRDLYPREVVVWGVQPGSLEVGVELSPAVAASFETLLNCVVAEFC